VSYLNKIKILNKEEKKQIEEKLKEQFGINEILGLLIESRTDRILLFQGNLNEKQIQKLERTLPIEKVGVYFATKIISENKIRLSIEGTQILKGQIKKNIFELNEQQAKEWMMGRELEIKTGKSDFLIMKYKDNFLGTGKASELKIGNFIPKNRRLKNQETPSI